MTYDTVERSTCTGRPQEFYRFTHGSDVYRYTSYGLERYHEWRLTWADEKCTGTISTAYPYATVAFGHSSGYGYYAGFGHTPGIRPFVAWVDSYGLSILDAAEGGAAGTRLDFRMCIDSFYFAKKAGVAFGFDPAAMRAAPTTTPFYAAAVCTLDGVSGFSFALFSCLNQTSTLLGYASLTPYQDDHLDARNHIVTLSVSAKLNSFSLCADDVELLAVDDNTIPWDAAYTGVGLWYYAGPNIGYPTQPYMDTRIEDYIRVYARDYAGSETDPLEYAANHYNPETITRGEIEQNQEDHTGSIDVTLPAANAVSLLFRDFLPVSPVQIVIFRHHEGDADPGIVVFSGTVSAVKYAGSEATLTCLPLSEAFRRPVPWMMFQSTCGHPLYSAACGVDRTDYAVTITIGTITGSTITAAALDTFEDRYFTNGWVQDSAGAVRWIVGHTGDTLTTVSPFTGLEAGDVVTVYPGCDRTEAVCEAKYDNLDNFGGWAHIPTKNPFDSSLT